MCSLKIPARFRVASLKSEIWCLKKYSGPVLMDSGVANLEVECKKKYIVYDRKEGNWNYTSQRNDLPAIVYFWDTNMNFVYILNW